MKKGRKIDDNRQFIHENRSTRWIPPAVAVRMREFRPLQEPIRLQDLLNSARSRAEKKIKDWILKSETIRKQILRFFSKQIIPRSLGSKYVKGTVKSTLDEDHDPSDLGYICLEKQHKICFWILGSNLGFSLKKHTLN